MKSIFHALNRLKVFRGLTEQEFAWVLYDVGNSAFTMLSCSLIPIWFKSLAIGAAPGQINSHQATAYYSIAVAVVTVIVALLGPIFGVLADHKDKKKVLFTTAAALGIFGCILNGFITGWLLFLILFVFTKICYSASLTIYDSMLNDITSEERMDEVSSYGFAWGYIGSCIPFIACLAVVLGGGAVGIDMMLGMKIAFVITAAWWVAFTIPLIRNVKQTHYKEREPRMIRNTFAGLGRTIKAIVRDRRLRLFMLAFFFYIDGVHTIIKMSTSYGTDLGIDSTQLVLALLVTQFVAFPSAIAYGRLSERFGTKRMLLVAVVAYLCIVLFAAFFLKSAVEFWVLAICVGLFQGGIQALSRSEFGKLIPKDNANEYYGFFDIFGKYAAVMGTFLVSVFTQITGNSSAGVLSIAVLFVIGFILLARMPEKE